ncbi:MAG: ATP-dependent Clp protease adaptor ClpS [Flavobacteriales bacterium]|nr:ATP-dependent Clp protease adaptor ClpS [Flavobacteriales bacterium]
MNASFDEEIKELLSTEETLVDERQIILHNDNVNTFDFVIESLMEVCGHDMIQAEQCTTLVHYKGRCSVKVGVFKVLEPMCTALLDRGLSAEID